MSKRINQFFTLICSVAILLIAVVIQSCNDEEDVLTPAITGFQPEGGGPVGSTMTISGTNFSLEAEENSVTFFDNVEATNVEVNDYGTELTVIVPEGAETGVITVTVNGVSVETASFTVTEPVVPAPTISGLSLTEGEVGSEVVISGTNFSTTKELNIVKFNGVVTTSEHVNTAGTELTVKVPQGAQDGPVTVTVNELTATFAFFNVLELPTIQGFSPTTGITNTTVTITGSNFSNVEGENIVRFNGILVTDFISASTTELIVKVPEGDFEGKISVSVNNGTEVSSERDFTRFVGEVNRLYNRIYRNEELMQEYTYLPDGKLETQRYVHPTWGSTHTYTYNQSGELETSTLVQQNGERINYRYSYNNGLLDYIILYENTPDEEKNVYIFENDRVKEIQSFNRNNIKTLWQSFEYTQNGYLMKGYSPNNPTTPVYTNEYTYILSVHEHSWNSSDITSADYYLSANWWLRQEVSGGITYISDYEWDEYGRIKKSTSNYTLNNQPVQDVYTYEYD